MNFDFIKIDKQIFRMKIKAIDKLVYSYITTLSNTLPVFNVTDEQIGTDLNEDIQVITRSIKRLKKYGLINTDISYYNENGRVRKIRTILANADVTNNRLFNHSTLSDHTVYLFSKFIKRYKSMPVTVDEHTRLIDSLPFNGENKRYIEAVLGAEDNLIELEFSTKSEGWGDR